MHTSERVTLRVSTLLGGRVLGVVVNTDAAAWRVVSVFFDRRMRGM